MSNYPRSIEDPLTADRVIEWIEANAVKVFYYRGAGKPHVRIRYMMSNGWTSEISGASLSDAVKNAIKGGG